LLTGKLETEDKAVLHNIQTSSRKMREDVSNAKVSIAEFS
jgi:hypothetical protein